MTTAITVSGLRKSLGDQVVLDGLDPTAPGGTVFALLDANSAGKTTTRAGGRRRATRLLDRFGQAAIDGRIALARCAAMALGGYLWSKQLFNRER
ncbi:hypothetical protein [Actinoplanes oblitus]|uniref:hypothetical protein n=1 Tax=Actinoplanes oblitus TaxID=3040509 RepID=UPI0038995905